MYLPLAIAELLHNRLAQSAHLIGVCDADGICQIHGAHTGVIQSLGKCHHLFIGKNSLKGAAQRRCHTYGHVHVGEGFQNPFQLCKGFIVGPVDICLVVGFADGNHVGNVPDSCIVCIFSAPEVGSQCPELHVGIMFQTILRQLSCICHLGNCLRAHERSDFHFFHTGIHQCVNHADFLFECQHLFQVLPAVSRTDFNNANFTHFPYASSTRIWNSPKYHVSACRS